MSSWDRVRGAHRRRHLHVARPLGDYDPRPQIACGIRSPYGVDATDDPDEVTCRRCRAVAARHLREMGAMIRRLGEGGRPGGAP